MTLRARAVLVGPTILLLGGRAAADPPSSLEPPPGVAEISDLDLEDLLAAPTVESASRRRQSLEDAPGAITVFEPYEVISAGRLDLAEIMRRVPGAWVVRTTANRFEVGMRGVGRVSNSGILVLVDGQRFEDATTGVPAWALLPVDVGEIERVEVLRGPGGTMYGADALSGVINIVTRAPHHGAGSEGSFGAGIAALPDVPGPEYDRRMNNFGSGYAAHNFWDAAHGRGLRLSAGFRNMPEWEPSSPSVVVRHGETGYHAGVTGELAPSPDFSLRADVRQVFDDSRVLYGRIAAPLQFAMSEQVGVVNVERKNLAGGRLTLRGSADGRRLAFDFTSRDAAGAIDEQDAVNTEGRALLQGDVKLGDSNVLTALGEASLRHTTGLYSSVLTTRYLGGALGDEWALFERALILNLAARYEVIWSEDSGDDPRSIRYANLNPRASLVWRVAGDHTVRLAAANAYRTPAPTENFTDVPFPNDFMPPVPMPRELASNPWLRPEQAQSAEAGYRGRPARWLRLDAAVWAQRVSGLVDLLRTDVPIQFENSPRRDMVGFDLGTQLRPVAAFSAYANYGFVHHKGGNKEFPAHIVAVGADGELPAGVRLGGDFTWAAATHINLLSLNAAQGLTTIEAVRTPTTPVVSLHASRRISEGTELFFSGTHLLALTQKLDDLRLMGASSSPIGMTLMLGISGRTP